MKINWNKATLYNIKYPNRDDSMINEKFEDECIIQMRNFLNIGSKKQFPLYTIKIMKQRISYAPGWRIMNWSSNQHGATITCNNMIDPPSWGRIDRCYANAKKSRSISERQRPLWEIGNSMVYGCGNYCENSYKEYELSKSSSSTKDYSYRCHPNGINYKYNRAAGYYVICYEYVGGNYWYDDINKIQY
ncbi:MAG: hypothetical protein E7Y34_02755, partial [Mycoplasma sp.]|nr:hypothetical protein [Mycoplasma sp.]